MRRSAYRLKVFEELLLAAFGLTEEGRASFTAEDLVVAAWRKFPDTFGLKGYYDDGGRLIYPDSNRVFAEVMGQKPIRKKGYLEKVGNKKYQLTEAGKEHARFLGRRAGEPSAEKLSLSREISNELKRLFNSKSFFKFKNNMASELTFHDACNYWGISPRSTAIEFKGRIANLLNIIETSRQVIRNKSVSFEHGGKYFTSEELSLLEKAHETLIEKFEADISVILSRNDERR